jgi:hypothetical protein
LEFSNRLHGRYYFFVLPWVLASFFAANAIVDRSKDSVRRVFAICAVLVGIGVIFALLQFSKTAFLFFIDFPEIFWFYTQKSVWHFIVPLFTIGALTVYATRPKWSEVPFTVGFGLLSFLGTLWVTHFLLSVPPTPADNAGKMFGQIIARDRVDNGVVVAAAVGLGDAEPYRLLFYMPAAYDFVVPSDTTPINRATVDDQKDWAIVVGNQEVRFPYSESLAIGRYTLYLRPTAVDPLYKWNRLLESRPIRTDIQRASEPPLFNIDNLGAEGQRLTASAQEVRLGTPVYVSGWAIDRKNNALAAGVDVFLDDTAYPARYGTERADVGAYFKNPRYNSAGFTAIIPAAELKPGRHKIAVHIIARDSSVFWESAPIVLIAR